ncbi:hypothetical protein ACQ4PT_026377 [Festuca glaucescens]
MAPVEETWAGWACSSSAHRARSELGTETTPPLPRDVSAGTTADTSDATAGGADTGDDVPSVLSRPDNGKTLLVARIRLGSPAAKLEVLVGMGIRSMRIMRVKNLNIYAFGLYIQPDSVCNKLGSKYASVPAAELKDHPDFYEDLLRENIHMTVRLVVSYNGLSIGTVRNAFEKSLCFRLQKMNPNTDYDCLKTFGSYFSEDIRIPAVSF